MKKGIFTLAVLLSTFSFAKGNVVLKPYGSIGGTVFGVPFVNLDLGLDVKTSVYKFKNSDLMLGGGVALKSDNYFNKKIVLDANLAFYPLIEARHGINKDLRIYTTLRPYIGFSTKHIFYNFNFEPGIEYKNFDFGVSLGYKMISAYDGNFDSMGMNIGANFGYNFNIPIR